MVGVEVSMQHVKFGYIPRVERVPCNDRPAQDERKRSAPRWLCAAHCVGADEIDGEDRCKCCCGACPLCRGPGVLAMWS